MQMSGRFPEDARAKAGARRSLARHCRVLTPEESAQLAAINLAVSGKGPMGRLFNRPEDHRQMERLRAIARRHGREPADYADMFDTPENLDRALEVRHTREKSAYAAREHAIMEWAGVYRADKVAPAIAPPPDPPAPSAVTIPMNPSEEAIIGALREKNARMTAPSLVRAALAKDPDGHSKAVLASMVKQRLIDNRRDTRPPGYGLVEWGDR
jgi:hypothetical protein